MMGLHFIIGRWIAALLALSGFLFARFRNEFARHKLLDFIGDLALLGHPVRGCFLAIRPGDAGRPAQHRGRARLQPDDERSRGRSGAGKLEPLISARAPVSTQSAVSHQPDGLAWLSNLQATEQL